MNDSLRGIRCLLRHWPYLLLASLLLIAPRVSAQGLSDMPTVERIKAEIKGSDPTDTLARQVAVFSYLMRYVDRIKSNRTARGPFTPEEQKLFDAYRLAGYQIDQDFKKTHTPAEAEAFGHLEGKYEFDSAFYKDWSTRLIGKQSAATYSAATSELAARQQKHYNEEMEQYKQATAAQQAADRQGGGGGLSNDPTAVATRRCLELGGSTMACIGKGFGTGFMSMIGFNAEGLTGPGSAGVVFQGFYKGPGTKTTLGFNTATVSIGSCGDLDANATAPPYTIEKRPGSVRIVVHNEPAPFTLALRPDGGLTGPGPVDVKGAIIVGYDTTTTQYYRDGVSVGAGYAAECGGPCRKETSTPIYRPKTERCTIGSYNAPPQPSQSGPPPPQQQGAEGAGLLGVLTGVFDTGELQWSTPPGLRMTGAYSSGRLLMEFSPTTVILDCGEAHVRLPYTVENTPDRFLVHVANDSGGPFTLAVEPDGSLRGTGSTTVNGRLVSGMQGENITYRSHPETCEVGTFRPKSGSGSTTKIAEGGATPAPPAALASGAPAAAHTVSAASSAPPVSSAPVSSSAVNRSAPTATPASSTTGERAAMRVLLNSTFDGGTNLLADKVVFVMREPMDSALRSLGAPLAAGVSPARAWVAFLQACKTTDCAPIYEQLKKHFVTTTKLDASGKATISTQAATTGTYYLFTQARASDGLLVWDVPANLAAGDNNITFTVANAEKLH